MSRILLLQTLIDKGACSSQVAIFRAKFGESVVVTEALCESVAGIFDWSWAARELLTATAFARAYIADIAEKAA